MKRVNKKASLFIAASLIASSFIVPSSGAGIDEVFTKDENQFAEQYADPGVEEILLISEAEGSVPVSEPEALPEWEEISPAPGSDALPEWEDDILILDPDQGEELEELCNIISSLTGELLNSEKIANTFLSVRKSKIDKSTIENYIGYFIDAFILREARRFDIKGRKEIGALRKYYFADTGLRNARLNFAFPDEGQMLENIVYNELRYNGYSVNVGTFDTVEKNKAGKSVRKNNEVDFYATKGIRSYYIQVTADISNETTQEREIRPYILLNDQIQKVIVVNKPIKETRDERGFTIIGITDFLLRFIKGE